MVTTEQSNRVSLDLVALLQETRQSHTKLFDHYHMPAVYHALAY